jgi:hypothetical protein
MNLEPLLTMPVGALVGIFAFVFAIALLVIAQSISMRRARTKAQFVLLENLERKLAHLSVDVKRGAPDRITLDTRMRLQTNKPLFRLPLGNRRPQRRAARLVPDGKE